MIWIIKMQNGGTFEAARKRKVIAQMVEYYGQNSDDYDYIKSIFYIKKNDKTDELCNKVVSQIQDIVDGGISEWQKIADQEYRGQKDIESEYYAGLL